MVIWALAHLNNGMILFLNNYGFVSNSGFILNSMIIRNSRFNLLLCGRWTCDCESSICSEYHHGFSYTHKQIYKFYCSLSKEKLYYCGLIIYWAWVWDMYADSVCQCNLQHGRDSCDWAWSSTLPALCKWISFFKVSVTRSVFGHLAGCGGVLACNSELLRCPLSGMIMQNFCFILSSSFLLLTCFSNAFRCSSQASHLFVTVVCWVCVVVLLEYR